MSSIEPSAEQLQAFIADGRDEGPIVMINLLRYRDRAEYPPGAAFEPCSGREAYERYTAAVLPLLAAVGGKPLWLGRAQCTLIGPENERWDDAVLVQYPSRPAFLAMVTNPDYQPVVVHRLAALADSRLVETVTAMLDL